MRSTRPDRSVNASPRIVSYSSDPYADLRLVPFSRKKTQGSSFVLAPLANYGEVRMLLNSALKPKRSCRKIPAILRMSIIHSCFQAQRNGGHSGDFDDRRDHD